MQAVVGEAVKFGQFNLTVAQIIKSPDGDILDFVASTDAYAVNPYELCEHEDYELDDPRLCFAVFLKNQESGWFCPRCRRLVRASPIETIAAP